MGSEAPLLPLSTCGMQVDEIVAINNGDAVCSPNGNMPSFVQVPYLGSERESLRVAAQRLKELKAQTKRHHTIVGEKSTYSVTLTHSPQNRKLTSPSSTSETTDEARPQGYRNNYKQSIIENKNEYWRSKCWCEVQKRRKSRKRIEAIDLMNRFQRYDRWERTAFRKVDWKNFYDEMIVVRETRPDFVVNPVYLVVAFVFLFALLYWWLSKY